MIDVASPRECPDEDDEEEEKEEERHLRCQEMLLLQGLVPRTGESKCSAEHGVEGGGGDRSRNIISPFLSLSLSHGN